MIALSLSWWPVLRDVLVIIGLPIAFGWLTVLSRQQHAQAERLNRLRRRKLRSGTQEHNADRDPPAPPEPPALPAARISVAELLERERGGGRMFPGPADDDSTEPHPRITDTGRCADVRRGPAQLSAWSLLVPGGQ